MTQGRTNEKYILNLTKNKLNWKFQIKLNNGQIASLIEAIKRSNQFMTTVTMT